MEYKTIRNIDSICGGLDWVLHYWYQEVNSDNSLIDKKSQKLYRETLHYLYVLSYQINTVDINEDIMAKFEYFFEDSEKLIMLYEKNKLFFDGLDRVGLIKEVLRKESVGWEKKRKEEAESLFEEIYKKMPHKNKLEDEPFYPRFTDDILLEFYIGEKEKYMEEDDYYSTLFYNTKAYLENNYHREIYFVLKHINKQLKGKNPGFLTKNGGMHYYNDEPIFRMKLIESLHKKVVCENKVFEDIDEYTFYREINFLVAINKLKLIKGNNNEFYYIIRSLLEEISDDSDRDVWFNNILIEFNLNERSYWAKSGHITGSNATESQEKLRADIDEVFKLHGT